MRSRTLVVALSLGFGLVLGSPASAQDRSGFAAPPSDLAQLERRLKELEAKVARLEREAAAAKLGAQASGMSGFSRAAGAVGGFGSSVLGGLGGATTLGGRSGLGLGVGSKLSGGITGRTGGGLGGTGLGGTGLGGTGLGGSGGIGTPSDQRKPSAARDAEKMEIIIVRLENIDASETVSILQQLLLEEQQQRIRLVADLRTNSILMNAHRDDLEKVAKVINTLDRMPPREREKGKGVDKRP